MENSSTSNLEAKNNTTPQTTEQTTPTFNIIYKPIKIESASKTSLKSSQEKNFRKHVTDSIPAVNEILEKIWPKKATLLFSKQKNYTNVYFINDEPCFLQIKDEAVVPHLRLLHKCISY
jgi:PUA domain protein